MTSLASTTDPAPTSSGLIRYIRDLWSHREFSWYLALSDFKARNASTALGLVWWVLNPLLLSGVYFLVFGIIFSRGRRGDPEYLGYLMSGMFAFQFTTGVISGAARTILSNSKLIVNLRFPRLLLTVSSIIASGMGFIVAVFAFFLIIIPQTGNWPGWSLLFFIPILLIQLVFNLGAGSMAARLTVPFRDVSNLIPYLMRMWLYLSPIIWPLELLDDVPEWVTGLMNLNPMFHILAVYRTALLGADFNPVNLVVAAGFAIVVALIGVITFVRFESKLVQYL